MSDEALWQDAGSIFRPSYSATWLFCAGALIPSIGAKDTAGYDAAVGTVFHKVMAQWLVYGRPDDWLNRKFVIEKEDYSEKFEIEVDEDMFSFGEQCLASIADIPGVMYVETRVDISELTPIPDQGGTADVAFCSPGLLDITDWKYGKGVQVFAFQNTQALCYAFGFFKLFDWIYHFKTIRIRIAQPRLGHFDAWEISREELLEWAEWAKGKAAESWIVNAPRTPSPKACQWCKVRLDCPALLHLLNEMADESFEGLVEPVTQETQNALVLFTPQQPSLTPALRLNTHQLAHLLKYRKMFEAWFREIGDELLNRALNGEDLSGQWFVTQGRSRRKYIDEEYAADMLRKLGLGDEDIYELKLKSPNQMEKPLRAIGVRGKLTKEYLKLIAPAPPGRPTLAPAGDNRYEIPNMIDDLGDLEDDDGAI